MKIYIIYDTTSGPSGGGNQFLKALAAQFAERQCLANSPKEADVFLFNSHHCRKKVVKLKRAFPRKPFFHRIDGPMRLYNNPDDKRDDATYWLNEHIADATIFQSNWSKQKNLDMGLGLTPLHTTIINAPDSSIFFPKPTNAPLGSPRPRLIATSWSDNPRKGFGVYQYLDEHHVGRDFDMTFVGRSPVAFKNIRYIQPLPSAKLAEELRRHDIFLTASEADPCSNSLIEALHCGLPVIALHDGGHPEIIQNAGLTFRSPEQVAPLVAQIKQDHQAYQEAIHLPCIVDIAWLYLSFVEHSVAQPNAIAVKSISRQDTKQFLQKKTNTTQ